MTDKTQPLRGFRDFLPQQALERQWLRNRLETIFTSWGFDPLETPTLEPLELFSGEIGEDEKLFFKFTDQGGRQVALRYDQTVPTARVVGQNRGKLAFPFRRYQIQTAFRAEKPQAGRYREFVQADADIFGTSSPLADAQVIALSADIYRQLGFKNARVLINDRALYKDMPYEAIVAIDKLEKIGEAGVIEEMVKKNISPTQAKQFLQTIQNSQPNQNIKSIFTYLKDLGFDKDWYQFQPTLARSFSYSSGPIWEVVINGFAAGSVLGGERYDSLVERISGASIPATGFAVGFDRTLEAAKQFGLIPNLATTSQVLVTIFSPSLQTDSLKLASQLRQGGLNTEIYPDPKIKLEKQLKYANRKGIPWVVVLGEEEAKNSLLALKNMASGEQKIVSTNQAVEMIQTKS